MAISVNDLLTKCGLSHDGVVRWRQAVPEHRPGIYIVSTHSDPRASTSPLSGYEADYDVLAQLKDRHPAISVDGAIASPEQVAARIRQFWIPVTTVLYVGLAGTSLKKRVGQYYTTKIGAAKPHAGGWWLKTVANLDDLFVHYSVTNDFKAAEQQLIDAFVDSIPAGQRRDLHDSERIAPFANVAVKRGHNKRHGLANCKDRKSTFESSRLSNHAVQKLESLGKATPAFIEIPRPGPAAVLDRVESQIITESDRRQGKLRVPARSKHAFPPDDCSMQFQYLGRYRTVLWRVNGHGSGTLGLGVEIMKDLGTTNDSTWLETSGGSVRIVE